MITNDYILRLLEQLGRAIGRMVRHRDAEQWDRAHDVFAESCEDLLGQQPRFLDLLDVQNAVRMLGKWHRVKMYSALLEADAAVWKRQGESARAAKLYRRALEIFLEGLSHGGRGDRELSETITGLLAHVGLNRLAPAYQAMIRELNLRQR
ncbi:MAG: hypothetical protein ABI333_16050 [bacterium]